MSLFSFGGPKKEAEERATQDSQLISELEAENAQPEQLEEEPEPLKEEKEALPISEPYTSSQEHLWEELARVDQLVRAQTVRWQAMIAANKPEKYWGMIHVTDAEMVSYLQAPFTPPGELPGSLSQQMAAFWQRSKEMATDIQARLEETEAATELRLPRLQTLFGLNDLEMSIILLCLLGELDARYRRLFGYLMDDCSRVLPTVDLFLQILHPNLDGTGDRHQMFSVTSPLLANHLIQLNSAGYGHEALSMQTVQLDSRIANYLLGEDELDGRLAGYASSTMPERSWKDLIMDQARLARLQELAGWLLERREQGIKNGTVLLHGPYGSDRLAAAQAICAVLQTTLLIVNVPKQIPENWPMIVALCYREASLNDAVIYWAGCEQLLACSQEGRLCRHMVEATERYEGLSFFASQTIWEPTNQFREQLFLRLEFPQPAYEVRHRIWLAHLPAAEEFKASIPERDILAELLANSFQFTRGQILDAIRTARGIAIQRQSETPCLSVDDLYAGCRRQSGQKLVTMARRIEPRTDLTFDDLILPAANRKQLEELRGRIQHRSQVYSGLGFESRLSLGKGLIVLFTGSSGTGKTMAAELLAREQGVELYKVDLSAVVSKYVGETEKNLSRVFAEAEDVNAIIFFDEADALFGKRGEVKEARDRWANIEINFLLQRVEEYAGTVILTSNLRQNIDEAFLRRIHSVVEFPFPSAEARFAIWRGMFPEDLQRPLDEALHPLADRFDLTGGSIKNIVLDSAFRALSAATPEGPPEITIRHLVASTGREYQKLGKPISKGEFSETYYEWLKEDIL